eukprot:CAMPEP_0116834906 /NCGR_PEP_ID=MMETSP0418-20121206/7247_1 /TAXON_ID=1158023 /ORGANISM="Astrosyne radiata, Strain 13vi08-1A" /LENGTH=558 /DNA_ID=CAMNT_0004464509 /DNA_START=145 /DNA_END=1822 /DNA_ORIENTATION=+
MDGEHPNRRVLFLDNSIQIPFLTDPNNPDLTYHMGFSLSPALKLKALVAEFEPSLIHITVADCTSLHLIQYAREKEIPLMGTYHSNIPEYMQHYPGISWLKFVLGDFFRHQYNFMQALYVPTPYIQRYLVDTFRMDKVTNVKVWGRGIDLQKFSPSHRSLEYRQKLGFSPDDVVITWVGRVVPEKRPDIFANVIRRLHAQGVPFKALVIGAGTSEEVVQNLPNTTFLGWTTGEELAVAYASSDLFLFPSSVETFGNVTLEAAASGLPLVVEGGCSGHMVNHGVNGYACHDEDWDAWFENTKRLVVDKSLRQSFGHASRQHSMQFEKRTVMRRMIDNYASVTNEFFCTYGGHHENRDRAYEHEDSFVGGNIPRPFGLALVESLFILVFRIGWVLSELFVRIFPAAQARSPTAPLTDKNNAMASLGKNSQVEHLDDEENGSDKESLITDNATVATEAGSVFSASGSSCPTINLCTCCGTPVSHILAKWFMAVMQFQFRMECRIRNGAYYCCHPSKWSTAVRKRKNSSMQQDSIECSPRMRGDEELGRRIRSSSSFVDVAV